MFSVQMFWLVKKREGSLKIPEKRNTDCFLSDKKRIFEKEKQDYRMFLCFLDQVYVIDGLLEEGDNVYISLKDSWAT